MNDNDVVVRTSSTFVPDLANGDHTTHDTAPPRPQTTTPHPRTTRPPTTAPHPRTCTTRERAPPPRNDNSAPINRNPAPTNNANHPE
ncbi:hypothetical protein K443DRAFT_14393 [Laccaria amethystina LaAM-08-1]|uniref:Uncharacterized protein n=1 Tax=Laccaria amethystina LaAM-08-1 TaxID=1095629 RepID=A0A0C9WMV6_9AGAR|nr:hypothetical protein K443DRAFT_14393 [Laccaria amethystina LaAM-08-1]